ncbi:hypothetical protein [Streptomyces parvus]|uniref:hypothetical protein n=1 Tax=Streptomyces parvus TaxID=66428 RepID=UPI0035E023DB
MALGDLGLFARETLEVADALRPTDSGRAQRLAADAARVIEASQSTDFLTDVNRHAVSTALGTSAPDRAERLARAISDQGLRTKALANLVAALTTDPRRAESIALSMDDELPKPFTLVALAVGTDEADRRTLLFAEAERAAGRLSGPDRVPALLALAKAYET